MFPSKEHGTLDKLEKQLADLTVQRDICRERMTAHRSRAVAMAAVLNEAVDTLRARHRTCVEQLKAHVIHPLPKVLS